MGEVLAAIAAKLQEYSQLRVGQLLHNVCEDSFYISNKDFAAAIREYTL